MRVPVVLFGVECADEPPVTDTDFLWRRMHEMMFPIVMPYLSAGCILIHV